MAQLPANVSYFMQRMQGLSTSQFKVFPQNSGNQPSSSIIRFELPSNSLLNTRSTRVMFSVQADGASFARLPNKIDSLIENVSIYAGGVLIQNNFAQYNLLRHVKDALMGDRTNPTLGHPEMCRLKSYHNGTDISNAKETYTDKSAQLSFDFFEGLLGSIEPSIIDTGLLPQITLEITLAPDAVCSNPDGTGVFDASNTADAFSKTSTTATTYKLSNVSLQVEVLNMASSVLDEIANQRIAQVGYLSLPFKNYFTYNSTHNETSRANVNSASWDRFWVAYRKKAYHTQGAPISVTGYKKKSISSGEGNGGDIGGVFDTNKEKYISKYFNMEEDATSSSVDSTFQLQVNSASVPSYKMTVTDALAMTQNALDGRRNNNLTLDQYRNNYFCQCWRFCLPESDFNRMASGLDTRSVSAQIALETTNINECNVVMFAECTSELRVGKFCHSPQQVQVGA